MEKALKLHVRCVQVAVNNCYSALKLDICSLFQEGRCFTYLDCC